jgi:hypothetical protein
MIQPGRPESLGRSPTILAPVPSGPSSAPHPARSRDGRWGRSDGASIGSRSPHGVRRDGGDPGLGWLGCLHSLIVVTWSTRWLGLRPGRLGLLDGALRMDVPTGVNGLVADRAAHPGRDRLRRGVIVPRSHQGSPHGWESPRAVLPRGRNAQAVETGGTEGPIGNGMRISNTWPRSAL